MMTQEQTDWLKLLLLGKMAGKVAHKVRPAPAPAANGGDRTGGGTPILGRAAGGSDRNSPQSSQPQASRPLPAAASEHLTQLGFAPVPNVSHMGGATPPRPAGAAWKNAPVKGAPQRNPAQLGATPDGTPGPSGAPSAGQVVEDGIVDTLTDDSNPLPFDAGAMLTRAVDDGTVQGGIAGEFAGAAVGGVLAAGTAVAKDADKVASGKMTAADATADVVVEGATGVGTALVGAEAGAAAGAAVGSVIPGLGTAIGGAVGFLVGGVAGYAAGQMAHSSGVLDNAKKGLGLALGGVEQPLQSAWGIAAEAVHAIGTGIDAVKNTANEAVEAVEKKAASLAGSLWDGTKGADPRMAHAA